MTFPVNDPVGTIEKIVGGVVAAIVVGLIVYLGYTKAIVEKDLAQSELQVQALTASNKAFYADTLKANAALNAANEEAKRREDAADLAIKQAQKVADGLNAQALALQNQKPVGKDDCDSANILFNSYIVRHK